MAHLTSTTRKLDWFELNYDMNFNLFLLKISFHNLKSSQDKHSVNRWVHKLLSSNKTLTDMRLRNDFMYHLVTAVQNGELSPPFNWYPPSSELSNLAYLLTGTVPGKESKNEQTECNAPIDDPNIETKNKTDNGTLNLKAHPAAKCGAFCYLAVVSKPPSKPANQF